MTRSAEAGSVEVVSHGHGAPVTVFLHGLGGSSDDTRPLARGIAGTHVFVHLRSHAGSIDADEQVTYDQLAADVWRAVDRAEAVQGFGVSLGSLVLMRMMLQRPAHFTRCALYLPSIVTEPRPAPRLGEALRSADSQLLDDYVNAELPPALATNRAGIEWLERRRTALRRPGIADLVDLLAREAPVPDPADAAGVTTDVLAIGAEHDPTHPAQAARDAAEIFPRASSVVFEQPAPLWTDRRRLRSTITDFFSRDKIG